MVGRSSASPRSRTDGWFVHPPNARHMGGRCLSVDGPVGWTRVWHDRRRYRPALPLGGPPHSSPCPNPPPTIPILTLSTACLPSNPPPTSAFGSASFYGGMGGSSQRPPAPHLPCAATTTAYLRAHRRRYHTIATLFHAPLPPTPPSLRDTRTPLQTWRCAAHLPAVVRHYSSWWKDHIPFHPSTLPVRARLMRQHHTTTSLCTHCILCAVHGLDGARHAQHCYLPHAGARQLDDLTYLPTASARTALCAHYHTATRPWRCSTVALTQDARGRRGGTLHHHPAPAGWRFGRGRAAFSTRSHPSFTACTVNIPVTRAGRRW